MRSNLLSEKKSLFLWFSVIHQQSSYYLTTLTNIISMVLPDGKHVMLSYNWKSQKIVAKVCDILKLENIPVWFDIEGGMKGDIYERYASHQESLRFLEYSFIKCI
jgi:hypothetical protein